MNEGQNEPDQFPQEEGGTPHGVDDILLDEHKKELKRKRDSIKFEGSIPKCFPDFKTYKHWVELARLVEAPEYGPCTDCTPEYKTKMMAEDKCENPHIIFVEKTTRVVEKSRPVVYTFLEGEPCMETYDKRGSHS